MTLDRCKHGTPYTHLCTQCNPQEAARNLASAGRITSLVDSTQQPAPTPNNLPALWDLVQQDINDRDGYGARKYNVRLQPFNGRDYDVDAYQEALDLVVYLRGRIYERAHERRTSIRVPRETVAEAILLLELYGRRLQQNSGNDLHPESKLYTTVRDLKALLAVQQP